MNVNVEFHNFSEAAKIKYQLSLEYVNVALCSEDMDLYLDINKYNDELISVFNKMKNISCTYDAYIYNKWWSKVRAKTEYNKNYIMHNWKHFKREKPYQIAGTIFHELIHMNLGLKHKSKWRPNHKDVIYTAGYAIQDIAKTLYDPA